MKNICLKSGCVIAYVLACLVLLTMIGLHRAHPRDLDGRYAASPLKSWFDGLQNKAGGNCCSIADGYRIDDADWDIKDEQYRVRINGQWMIVPPEALVTVPNKVGRAMVWPVQDVEGKTVIRCFMPGVMG